MITHSKLQLAVYPAFSLGYNWSRKLTENCPFSVGAREGLGGGVTNLGRDVREGRLAVDSWSVP